MRGQIVIFDNKEWRVISHNNDHLKLIEMGEELVFPRIKLVPFSKISFLEENINKVILPQTI